MIVSLGLLAVASSLFQSKFKPIPNALPPQGSIMGNLQIIRDFKSKVLDNQRTIRVWLPPGYSKSTGQRYPVLYMDDGQNLFDATLSPFSHHEWRCDETAFALIKSKLIKPLIIVGIDSVDRNNELLPTYSQKFKCGGLADKYDQFVINEVKPFIDSHYRTKTDRNNTYMGGSSFGGINTLYMGLTHSDIFSKLLVISAWYSWDEPYLFNKVSNLKSKLPLKIWLDMGSDEGDGAPYPVNESSKMAKLLESKGWRIGKDLAFFVDYGAKHSEEFWARRFGMMLLFIDSN